MIPAEDLVGELLTIESQLGRDRTIRWDSRAIDIDLLLYGRKVIESPNLSVPHPRMSFRKFVLEPAAEIAGFMIDPISGWTLAGLLRYLQDAPRYVAVVSSDVAIAEWIAEGLCKEFRCPRLEKTFAVSAGVGDSQVSAAVEFSEWAIARLSSSCWERDKALVKRLPAFGGGGSQQEISPVVSAFWYDEVASVKQVQTLDSRVPTQRGEPLMKGPPAEASTIHPALVIVAEPRSKENFWKKLGEKKRKKMQSIYSNLSQRSLHESSKCKGHGPMAHLLAENPSIVMQEAIAAIRSVWPELSCHSNS